MAHIPDGILSPTVLIAGTSVAITGLAIALRKLDAERIPQAAILAAAFFVLSLISIPIGGSSVHLMLNGLMGILLGWTAIPTLFISLLLQAVFFGFGGLLVLGVNTLNIALPALLVGLLLGPIIRRSNTQKIFFWSALAGGAAVALTGAMVAASLFISGQEYQAAASVMGATYLPLLIVEALVTGSIISFIHKVSPEILHSQDDWAYE